MSITAIVPVWNGRELLATLLDSLEAQTERASEVLVVDNGSHDGAPELARERGARVLSMGRNAGFAAAVNHGIREARTEWIAVLNSDVTLAPDYFARLMAADAWFATGKLLGLDGRIDATFDAMSRSGATWRVGNGCADGPAFAASRRIASAPWTAALFRADIFRKVGLLEESFESYLEDVDFGLRCAAHGVSGMYVPEAVGWHRGSATLGRWHPETVRRIARNQVWLLARHYPTRLLLRWAWPIVVGQGLWGGVAWRHGGGRAWIKGIAQGIGSFARARGTAPFVPGLIGLLSQNERIIWEVQASLGFDSYWKLYFRWTGGGA